MNQRRSIRFCCRGSTSRAELLGVDSLVQNPKPLAEVAELTKRLLEIPPQTA